MDSHKKLYLASGSPRRRELLAQIGVPFERLSAEVDESVQLNESPEMYVQRLAIAKARAGLAHDLQKNSCVLGADTAVVLHGTILGKPQSRADALAMLGALSGQIHEVLTAVALISEEHEASCVVKTKVHFRVLSSAECEAYWQTGEPHDKAGSYGIQGLGAVFVQYLEGSYSAVVGLPLAETATLLAEFGIPCWQSASMS